MLVDIDVLSVWELAHRWHDEDPNLTIPTALPLKVQDSLRFLTHLMYRHELSACSPAGIEYKNRNHAVSFEDFRAHGPNDKADAEDEGSVQSEAVPAADNADEGEKWEKYSAYVEGLSRRHDKIVESFEQCFRGRIYDKEMLDNVFVLRHVVGALCVQKKIPVPAFWFPTDETVQEVQGYLEEKAQGRKASDPLSGRHADNRLDKHACRAVAMTLWHMDPNMTIEAVTKHRGIQQFANGAQYGGRSTLREWIKDLDPRDPKKRIGRPKKAAP